MAQRRYFDPDSGEEIGPDQLAAEPNVRISPEGYGQMSLNSDIGPVYTGFGAPPRQKAPRSGHSPVAPTDVPETFKDKVVSGVAGAGRVAKETLMDPEAIASMVGGAMGRTGPGGMLMAGGASGGVATVRNLYKRSTDPEEMKKPLSDMIPEVGTAFATGALGEGIGRGMTAGIRPKVEPRGKMVQQFFGKDNVMPQQLTDSAPLNFMAQVAKHGPGGTAVINEAEQRQSQTVLDYLMELSHKYAPSGMHIDTSGGGLNAGDAGRSVQRSVAGSLKDLRSGNKYQEFLSKYGDLQGTTKSDLGFDVTDPAMAEWLGVAGDAAEGVTKSGPKLSALHQRRSDLLKQARSAYRAGDEAAQAKLMGEADKVMNKIDAMLPDDAARNTYRSMADEYKAEINRLDNPTVRDVRKGKADDVIDKILNNRLRNYDPMNTKMGQTNAELLTKVRDAVDEPTFDQLRADTLYEFGQRAVDPKTGMVDAGLMEKHLGKLDEDVQHILFGDNKDSIKRVLAIVQQAQKYNKSEAGRLFIAIRSGGAAVALTGGIATGNPTAGTATAAGILLSPYAFAKLLTSNVGRTLLTRAAGANVKTTAGQQAARALRQFIVTSGLEEGREEMITPGQQQPAEGIEDLKNFGLDDPNGIPEPPQ